jgi:hypothetical protein
MSFLEEREQLSLDFGVEELGALASLEIPVTDQWSVYQQKIQEEAIAHPSSFLRQGITSFTLHPNQQALGARYLSAVTKCQEFYDNYSNLLNEDNFGNPFCLREYPRSSPLLVQHIHHLIMIQRAFGKPINDFGCVVEFGGGYGSLARLLDKLEYAGKHLIVDLPFMSELQRFYLANIPRRTLCDREWFNDLPEAKVSTADNNLLVATWSFSETPLELRDRVKSELKKFGSIFLLFQRKFSDIDNLDYFSDLAIELGGVSIRECELYPGNYYFIRKASE